MTKLKILMLHYWKTISVSVGILFLCLIPGSEFKKIPIEFDKTDLVVHFIMFFTLSFILYQDSINYTKQHDRHRFLLIISVLACLLFGMLTELLQYTIISINRTGSLMDLAFDLIGSVAGVTAAYFIKRKSFPAT